MENKALIKEAVSKHLGLSVSDISHIGKGASARVYLVHCDGEPNKLAVKISSHPELLKDEYDMLKFLSEKTESKIPKTYFLHIAEGIAVLGMEFVSGVSGAGMSLFLKRGKKHLADSIIDNLILIQKAHNDKFGPYNNAVYDTWQEYYRKFSEEIYSFCIEKYSKGGLNGKVMKAIELSYKNFDKIFCEEIKTPTLIHGDYWMPNFIIDEKSMELISAVDPFNIMWADPEYELFALTVGKGKRLHLYENYKSKVNVSKHCNMKLHLYALYSELLWYKKLGGVSEQYLKERARGLLREMKKLKVI